MGMPRCGQPASWHNRGHFPMLAATGVAVAATITANQFLYWMSRTKGRKLLERKVGEDPRSAPLGSWARWRAVLLPLFSRFLYGLRTAIPTVCGALGMPPGDFFVTNLAGGVVWGMFIDPIGSFGGHLATLFLQDISRHERAVALRLLLCVMG